ncbi:hypothetical protein [Burkholderia contaminans]|uniref:hypothetical protein n=1 Tax=Burkholderia contaminans TaxID=488447 RepID=UPI0015A572F8|nr:hypothetical protein [Burkholderia contaminans]
MTNGFLQDDATAFHAGINDAASFEFFVWALTTCGAQRRKGSDAGADPPAA